MVDYGDLTAADGDVLARPSPRADARARSGLRHCRDARARSEGSFHGASRPPLPARSPVADLGRCPSRPIRYWTRPWPRTGPLDPCADARSHRGGGARDARAGGAPPAAGGARTSRRWPAGG